MRRLKKYLFYVQDSSTVFRKHQVAANGISEEQVSSAGKYSLKEVT